MSAATERFPSPPPPPVSVTRPPTPVVRAASENKDKDQDKKIRFIDHLIVDHCLRSGSVSPNSLLVTAAPAVRSTTELGVETKEVRGYKRSTTR
jgi:hypothetical protein